MNLTNSSNSLETELDILKELHPSEWPSFRDVFKNRWPYSIYPYYVIQSFINWKYKDNNVNVKIFCPRDGYENGTLILIHATQTLTTIYAFTLDDTCQELRRCLSETKLIDWTVGPYIHSVHQDHWDAVKAALLKLKLGTEYQIQSTYHWLPKEEAMKFDIKCPPDVYIADLGEKDILTINDVWPHRYPGSEVLIRDLLFVNGGLGIYSKNDNKLRSWIIKNHHLGLGMLQTVDEHKKKGYGKLMIMAMSKSMALEGLDIHTMIVRTNHVSLNLFKSLGFRKIDNLMFEKIKPKIKSHI